MGENKVPPPPDFWNDFFARKEKMIKLKKKIKYMILPKTKILNKPLFYSQFRVKGGGKDHFKEKTRKGVT